MKGAIITHYFKSKNYGGNLQAYALCKVIKELGYDVEQISYNNNVSIFRKPYYAVRKFIKNIRNYKIKKKISMRDASILRFNKDEIPHSEIVYDANNIDTCAEKYDFFITGSDQVWNSAAYCPAYGLEFVKTGVTKISYAASISMESLDNGYKETLKKALSDYDAISVREIEAIQLLKGVTNKKVHRTLDPTLLLTECEWNELSSERKINEPYLFCYFLGDNTRHREIAKEIAKEKKLKIVNIPYLLGHYRRCDDDFGDINLFDVSPNDFISLIRYSNMVCTDSFHAVAFSCIYEKEFIVFDRVLKQSMGSRIHTLTNVLGINDHFCDDEKKMSIEYIRSLKKIDYVNVSAIIREEKKISLEFLKRNLSFDL